MPLQETSGNVTTDAYGGGVAAVPNYIEDVFSTYLYTGNGSTQTITNGIDLSTKGGLVWIKDRTSITNQVLTDTSRGTNAQLNSNSSGTGTTSTTCVTAFNTTGFNISTAAVVNQNLDNYASWTFRKQPKFFDVVTWTGDSNNSRMLSHSLGSVPGCIITKCTSTTSNWFTWHRASSITSSVTGFEVNTTAAANTTGYDASADFTSTQFRPAAILDSSYNEPNVSGRTYVAYIFAHNAGGFGLTGTDNVISCGSVTANGSGAASINLGYEPQWIMLKNITSADSWYIYDNMRGLYAPTTLSPTLRANITNAEVNSGASPRPNATGVSWTAGDTVLTASNTYIYIAIRRGPMKVPTSGTSVFVPYTYTGNGSASRDYSAIGIVTDMNWTSCRSNNVSVSPLESSRLQGNTARIQISSTGAEATGTYGLTWNAYQNGVQGNSVYAPGDGWNSNTYTYIGWNFRRAPSFFDEVCYTGTGVARTLSHNLGVAPELIIVKSRSLAGTSWPVYNATLGASNYLRLQTTDASTAAGTVLWNATTPTSSVFSIGDGSWVSDSGSTFVAYLFATCAGVSKVGSYTGTGTTKQVDCGFTGGARFVLIKRTDSTGDWYVWDTARGIVSGNDPYLLLNSTAAEVTNTDYIDTYSAGFEISSTAPAAINASGGTFIFLAIA